MIISVINHTNGEIKDKEAQEVIGAINQGKRLLIAMMQDLEIDPGNAHFDTNGFSISYGFGRLNARRALEIAKEMT
jgi:hypothetical protein